MMVYSRREVSLTVGLCTFAHAPHMPKPGNEAVKLP